MKQNKYNQNDVRRSDGRILKKPTVCDTDESDPEVSHIQVVLNMYVQMKTHTHTHTHTEHYSLMSSDSTEIFKRKPMGYRKKYIVININESLLASE